MSDERLHARFLAELGFIENIVRKELDMPATLYERSADVPYHTLVIDLERDARGNQRQLAMNFYPLDDEEFADTLMLQYFIGLPFPIAPGAAETVRAILPVLNNKVVLGHFGITDGQGQLHYRYVQPLRAANMVEKEDIANVIMLVSYTPMLFGEVLQDTAAGTLSLQQALHKIEQAYAG